MLPPVRVSCVTGQMKANLHYRYPLAAPGRIGSPSYVLSWLSAAVGYFSSFGTLHRTYETNTVEHIRLADFSPYPSWLSARTYDAQASISTGCCIEYSGAHSTASPCLGLEVPSLHVLEAICVCLFGMGPLLQSGAQPYAGRRTF